jgi:soluble lytic murein transglycosylase-like protein
VITTEVVSKSAKPTAEKEQRDARLITVNERIGKQITWYSQRPSYLQQVAERARPYLYHIVSELNTNHLPTELALLPIVESAYQPTAQSPKSAAGLWQFIPSTGLDFDLAQSDHYDDRLDITASTQAAVRYLSLLKRHFNGDWLLALAAYNCGQGRVDDAISSNRANGLPTDYWSLHLPEETQDYVPRFLALSSIFANPKAYGLKLPAVKNEPYFVKVKVDRKFDIDYLSKKQLATIAELANLSYEQFVQLNPGYLKSTLAVDRPFTLLLPANNANQLHQHLTHVAQFLAEPASETSLLLHKKTTAVSDNPKDLPIASAVTSLLNKPATFSGPVLSLNLNINQTTPRITSQPVLTDIRANLG